MEELKKSYIESASSVLSDNEDLASASITFKEMFTKSVVSSNKEKLRKHFEILSDLDKKYVKNLTTNGTINDLLIRNAKIQILAESRNMLVSAIKNYESSLTEYEGQVKFRLNITIALIAIIVSIIGVIF